MPERSLFIPVILGPILSTPGRRDDPYDSIFANASKLKAAGVDFCISTNGGGFGAMNVRNLPYHAAMAASFGLAKEDALKSVTLWAAKVLGVDHDLGSIEAGKSASLMVTDGDPLDIRTQVLHVFIDGREQDLSNRQKRLYDRYTARPKPAAARTGGR